MAIIGPRTTLASARDPEMVLYRMKHEHRHRKPLRSNKPLWKFFKDSLPGIAAGKLCKANDDFADGQVRFGSFTHLRQHLDTKWKEHCETLQKHAARGAGSKSEGSGGASSEKDAESMIAYMGLRQAIHEQHYSVHHRQLAAIIDGLG